MHGFRRCLGHYHETQTHCAAAADTLDHAADDQFCETHRAAADSCADCCEDHGNDPYRSVIEHLAHHCEVELAGCAEKEVYRVDPECAC